MYGSIIHPDVSSLTQMSAQFFLLNFIFSALMMAVRLNINSLKQEVIETIPVQSSKYDEIIKDKVTLM